MSCLFVTTPPVGKSGAGKYFINSSNVASGFCANAHIASMDSPKLCGAMFVATATAIPLAPLINKFGTRAGSTSGSS